MKIYKTHQLGGSKAPNYCAGVNDISAHYGLTNLHKVHNRNDLFWHTAVAKIFKLNDRSWHLADFQIRSRAYVFTR